MSFDEDSRREDCSTDPQPLTAAEEVFAPRPLTESAEMPEEAPLPEKKSKKPLIIAICCAVLVVALGVLAAIFLPRWLDKSFSAEMGRVSDKMKSISSCAFEAELSINTDSENAMPIAMDGEMTIDRESGEALMHMEYGYSSSIGELYLEVANKQLTYYFLNTDGNWYRESVDLQTSSDVQAMDWESLLEQAGLSSYVLAGNIPQLQKQLQEKLQNDEYLKDVWGYSREGSGGNTVYAFSPDWSKAVAALLEDAELIMTQASYEELLQPSEEALAEFLSGIDVQATLTADAQHYPKAVSVTVALSDELVEATQLGIHLVGIEPAFSDYNSTSVEIPPEVIQNAISGG